MISLLGINLGVSAPLVARPIPLGAIALFYAYRKGGSKREVRVPTLFLLQELSQPVQAPQNVKLPLRLLFELLLLLALTFAISRVFVEGTSEAITVVVDNSLSSAARAVGSKDEPSVLTKLKLRAQKHLESLSATTRVQVVQIAPTPELKTKGFVSRSEALQHINEITELYARDDAEGALREILSQRSGTPVLFLSDKRLDRSDPRTHVTGIDEHIELSRADNVAVISASWGPFDAKGTTRLKIGVARFTNNSSRLPISIQVSAIEGSAERLIDSRRLELTGSSRSDQVFSLDVRSVQRLVVSVGRSDGLADSLPLDDRIFVVTPDQQRPFMVVGPVSAKDLGLQNLGRFSFISKTLSDYVAESRSTGYWESIDSPALIVFHRSVPPSLPPCNALFVVPPESNNLFSVKKVSDPQITRWLNSHPINSYLQLPLLQLKSADVVQVPPWGQGLIFSNQGPLAVVGELEEKRVAALGFEIFPYDGKNSPLINILTLNVFNWLSGGEDGVLGAEPHRVQMLGTEIASASLVAGSSQQIKLVSEPGGLFKPELPGFFEAQAINGQKIVRAVNFIDEAESDVSVVRSLSVDPVPQGTKSENSTSLFRWFALAALMLLLMELLFLLLRSLVRSPRVGGRSAI